MNKMSVFTFGYRPSYYLRKPWRFFHDLYCGFRNFIHRGKYGFAYSDVWAMDEYLLDVIPLMLRYLAEHSHGYPGVEPFETPEKYTEWLIQLAEKFENCSIDYDEKNEYSEAFRKQADDIMKRNIDKDKPFDMAQEMTTEEKIIRNKYFDRMETLSKEQNKNILDAYTELAAHHDILWD